MSAQIATTAHVELAKLRLRQFGNNETALQHLTILDKIPADEANAALAIAQQPVVIAPSEPIAVATVETVAIEASAVESEAIKPSDGEPSSSDVGQDFQRRPVGEPQLEPPAPVQIGFAAIALPLAAKGIPMTPVTALQKGAFLPDWQKSATTDPEQIHRWDKQYPSSNGGCVARAEIGGVWFWEVDSSDALNRMEKETGQKIPDTFRVRSRPGRGHFYFRQTAASILMGNLSQTYVMHGDWSARVKNAYVVAPGSINPLSGLPYETLDPDAEIVEAPDWLVQWLTSQKVSKDPAAKEIKLDARGLVPHGQIHGWLLSQGGKMRQTGMEADEIEPVLLRMVHAQCAPPIDESKVKKMAKSVCDSFAAGVNTDLLMTQTATAPALPKLPELPTMPSIPYPVFPDWVMAGTSVYEGLVKPVCDANTSRIPYFMFMPAVTVMLNYLGTKVRVELKNTSLSSYVVLIGLKGQTKKSSCMDDAINYFGYIGVAEHAERDIKNADGKSMVFTAGSPEGLGLDMQRLNCKNAVLFYDELSILANKAGIESSSLKTALLTMHESKKQANGVKSQKESYSLLPGTYVLGLIAGCTTKNFPDVWARISSGADGMDDRFSFFLQPEVLPERSIHTFVNIVDGTKHTKTLLDRALAQQKYSFVTLQPLKDALGRMSDRDEIRAEKYALFFAVDLGRTEIDEDCIRRALAIVDYEIAVKKYNRTSDADNTLAVAQLKVRALLERAPGGWMTLKELEQKMNCSKYGTMVWAMIYGGLIKAKIITETGEGTKADPTGVQVLKILEDL